MSRTVVFVLASGSGREPTAASTMSICTVFEPMSSTPSRVECRVECVFGFVMRLLLLGGCFDSSRCRRRPADAFGMAGVTVRAGRRRKS